LEGAHWCADRGIFPIAIPYREKKPIGNEWQKQRISLEQIPKYFSNSQMNIGALLGINGLADIDLDCIEAVHAAPELLPSTEVVFGRKTKPRSHYFYFADPPLPTVQYKDPFPAQNEKDTLVELRCTKKGGTCGHQTIIPPSTHRDTGERIQFELGHAGYPARVKAGDLQRAASRVAAASLLARHWARPGSQNAAFLALAGVLCRADWVFEDASAFHRGLYRALWPDAPDLAACESEVRTTFDKSIGGAEITGAPTLRSLINPLIVSTALRWLKINEATDAPAEWNLAQAPDSSPDLVIGEVLDMRRRFGEFSVAEIIDRCQVKRPGTKRRPWLSDAEKRLVHKLCDYARKSGEAFLGQERLARELGMSRKKIGSTLASLKEKKLLRWRRERSNHYELLYHSIYAPYVNTASCATPHGEGG
jgi:hypothetical protein